MIRARRALLVAAETFGLTGCEHDAALMGDVLGRRGFEVELLQGGERRSPGSSPPSAPSSRATGPGDAVVVYYSGHGGRMPHPGWAARQAVGRPAHIQFLVPTDIAESTADDFRGLLAEELTEWQWRLTDATRNVTTILDCCHSAFMARGLELVPKAVARRFPSRGSSGAWPRSRPSDRAPTRIRWRCASWPASPSSPPSSDRVTGAAATAPSPTSSPPPSTTSATGG